MAQLQTGNLYGQISDSDGADLPGVTVTLSGAGAPQVQITNTQGEFRYLGLSPGRYQLTATPRRPSQPPEYENINIALGRNTTIEVVLSSAVEDVIYRHS